VILRLAVLTQYRHVTNGQTDRHTMTASITSVYRRAGTNTRNACKSVVYSLCGSAMTPPSELLKQN